MFFKAGDAADLCWSEGRNDAGEADKTVRTAKLAPRKVCLANFREQ
jgi:hypothetical protein